MKVVIAGAGDMGNFIARYLLAEEHDIVVIDTDAARVRDMTDNESVAGFLGETTSLDVLKAVDMSNTDMFVSVTPNDEINILACFLADSLGVPTKIARIQNPNYLQENFLDLFHSNKIPVSDTISVVDKMLDVLQKEIDYSYFKISDIVNLCEGNIMFFSVYCDPNSVAHNRSIESLYQDLEEQHITFKVAGIYRNNNFNIVNDEEIIRQKDKLYIVADSKNIEAVYALFYNIGESEDIVLDTQQTNIVIAGDHSFIKQIAVELAQTYKKVKVVMNKEKSEVTLLAIELEKYNIELIIDDITKTGYREHYLSSPNDVIVTMYKNDNDNVLQALLLQSQKFTNIFCCLNSNLYVDFLYSHKINRVFIPDHFIMSSILANIRRGIIQNIFSLYNKVEIMEVSTSSNSNLIGKRIEDLELGGKMKILSLMDESTGHKIPLDPNTIIQSNNNVVFIIQRKHIKTLEDNVKYE